MTDDSKNFSKNDMPLSVVKTDAEWKKELSPEAYRVMREAATEAPFSGEYVHTRDGGTYKCRACGNKLFASDTKFDSGTGWPSFGDPINLERVQLREDNSLGMHRTEVICRRCGAHLGHLFDDGPKDRGGKRYCINSICLELEK